MVKTSAEVATSELVGEATVAVVAAAKVRRPRTEEQKQKQQQKELWLLLISIYRKLNAGPTNNPDLITKLNTTVMANDVSNELLPAALASLPKAKRGRAVGNEKKPFNFLKTDPTETAAATKLESQNALRN